MHVQIAELAKEYELIPGQVAGALTDLGVEHDAESFETDEEALELIREALSELQKTHELVLPPHPTPRDVARALGVKEQEVQKTLMLKMKVMATLTTSLKDEVAEKLVGEFGYKLRFAHPEAKPKPQPAVAHREKHRKVEGAQPRPPVVTILGHVDHGKTSLLDYIRKSNVASKEHGGITQHIGAYQVELPEGKITFLDTPGHAAFTAMRARGAQVTDIAILVVAADDGIMPQTIEAIGHVHNAEVPMIVAINKIDRPDANPDRVMTQLPEYNVVPEAFGGQVIVCPVSAVTGEGVKQLLEMVLLQAEVMQLSADPRGSLKGVVVEAKVDKGRGPVATVLVQEGTLRVGDSVVVGTSYGKIKAMIDYKGDRLKEAGPSTPVEILGLSDVPNAGDKLESAEDERTARNIATERADQQRIASLSGPVKRASLKDLMKQGEEGEAKDLNLIVKADVQGSVEAVRGMLEKIENPEVSVKVVYAGVGPVTVTDVNLASASNAICVGFNVRPEGDAKREAEKEKVEIRTYTIIYELVEDIEAAVKGMLAPKFEEEHLGTVEIRVVFKLSRSGFVAGSHVTEGKVVRGCSVRVRRDREIVYEGKIESLKNVKQDVREMVAGQDCGIQFDNWTEFAEGDVVEAYELVQID